MSQKAMISDKVFKITVIALLLLILGAALGTLSTIYLPSDEFLELEEEFALLEGDVYQYNSYTYDEFSTLVQQQLASREDILAYAAAHHFEVEEEHDIIELYREDNCQNDALGRFICFEEIITFVPEEHVVEHTLIGYREDE